MLTDGSIFIKLKGDILFICPFLYENENERVLKSDFQALGPMQILSNRRFFHKWILVSSKWTVSGANIAINWLCRNKDRTTKYAYWNSKFLFRQETQILWNLFE